MTTRLLSLTITQLQAYHINAQGYAMIFFVSSVRIPDVSYIGVHLSHDTSCLHLSTGQSMDRQSTILLVGLRQIWGLTSSVALYPRYLLILLFLSLTLWSAGLGHCHWGV